LEKARQAYDTMLGEIMKRKVIHLVIAQKMNAKAIAYGNRIV